MPVGFDTLKAWYTSSRTFLADWQEENKDLRLFVSGHQWSAEDADKLRRENRPATVFNRTEVIIDSVTGSEMNNRHETSYQPIEVNDSGAAETVTAAVAWARHRCQADDEESDAFRDMVIGGVGCTRTGPDYDGDQPEVVIERVDIAEMVWDHRSKKRNLRDRRYAFRARRIDAMTATETWDRPLDEINASWAETAETGREHSGLPGRAYETAGSPIGAGGGQERKDVTIVEAEWWERETHHKIIAMGQVIDVDSDQVGVLKRRLDALGAQYQVQKQKRKVYYRGVMGRDEFIEMHKMDPQKGGFRFKFMTAKREKQDEGYLWYGIARSCKDPQMWANKFFSQVLHIINSGALGRVIAEEDAFSNFRKAQQDWSKPNAWIMANRDAIAQGRFIEAQPPPIPVAIVNMLEFAISSIRECSGISPELLGQLDRNQPASLEYQRRQAGMNVLAVLFDALTQYREEQGYLMLHMVLTHMNDGRLVRIVGEQGEKFVPFLYEEGATEFDIKVSEAPSAPDQKEKMWAAIQSMVPHLLRAQVPPEIWGKIVRYSPLPTPLAEDIANWLEDMGKQPEGPTPEQEMAMKQAMAEIAKTESETVENRASALLDVAKAEQARAEGQMEGQRLRLDALEQLSQTADKFGQPSQAELEEQKQLGADRQQIRQLNEQAREAEANRQAQARLAQQGRGNA